MNQLALNNKTMTSTEIAEILGYEKKEVNKKVRAMFGDAESRELFSPVYERGILRGNV